MNSEMNYACLKAEANHDCHVRFVVVQPPPPKLVITSLKTFTIQIQSTNSKLKELAKLSSEAADKLESKEKSSKAIPRKSGGQDEFNPCNMSQIVQHEESMFSNPDSLNQKEESLPSKENLIQELEKAKNSNTSPAHKVPILQQADVRQKPIVKKQLSKKMSKESIFAKEKSISANFQKLIEGPILSNNQEIVLKKKKEKTKGDGEFEISLSKIDESIVAGGGDNTKKRYGANTSCVGFHDRNNLDNSLYFNDMQDYSTITGKIKNKMSKGSSKQWNILDGLKELPKAKEAEQADRNESQLQHPLVAQYNPGRFPRRRTSKSLRHIGTNRGPKKTTLGKGETTRHSNQLLSKKLVREFTDDYGVMPIISVNEKLKVEEKVDKKEELLKQVPIGSVNSIENNPTVRKAAPDAGVLMPKPTDKRLNHKPDSSIFQESDMTIRQSLAKETSHNIRTSEALVGFLSKKDEAAQSTSPQQHHPSILKGHRASISSNNNKKLNWVPELREITDQSNKHLQRESKATFPELANPQSPQQQVQETLEL